MPAGRAADRARLPGRTRVYAPVNPDLKGIRTRAGDYVEISSPTAWIAPS
jgi:hypothetical protein